MTTAHLDSDVRRHQIVQTARRIVASQGIAHLTIHGLAQEVGVSEGAIYRHFKSKDEILLVLIKEIEHNLLEDISESLKPRDTSINQLWHLMQRHFSSPNRNGVSFVRITEALRFENPQVKQATRQMLENYLDTLANALRAGVRNGEVSAEIDPRAAALMFFGITEASVTLWSFNNRAHPLTQHSAALWTMFRNALTHGLDHSSAVSPQAAPGDGDSAEPASGSP